MHRETIEARGSVRGGAAVSAGPGGLSPLPDLPDLDRYGGPFELVTSDGEPHRCPRLPGIDFRSL